MKSLKRILDGFYNDFDFAGHLRKDPIEFPLRYADPPDREAAAFIASCLAYGKVELFKPVIEKILLPMGNSPHAFLLDFDVKRQGKTFTVKYRFNEREDILCLLFLIHEVLKRHSSLEACFRKHYSGEESTTGGGIAGFMEEIIAIDTSGVYGRNIRPRGLLQFFPSPAGGSACKRMNLFLRWMVRDRDIDLGIWKGIPKNRLVIPLDTHIARISRCIGLTGRASADWKAAVEITEALKKFDPDDPLKYDFALCHHGISGLCRSRSGPGCRACFLKDH
ncbi:MAG: TIGR02757 family protein [Nitrospirae bacterium]|nr:TIGR02757 family protein [Nitrospirota bacterium]